MTLLQILTQTAADTAAAANGGQVAHQTLNMFDLMKKGGWVMWPLGVLSVIAVYLIVERYIVISRASKVDPAFMANIKSMLLSGKTDAALSLCRSTNTPIARLLEKGIKRLGKPVKEIESAVENTGKLEIYKLEKNLSYLGIIAGIAPMFGFVGTILGVIRIFFDIAQTNDLAIGVVANGLYQKMITSATGLIIGIVAHIGFHYLNTMIDRVSFQLESTTVEFIDLIQEPTEEK
jgi:biopolymer transport protein ExbB